MLWGRPAAMRGFHLCMRKIVLYYVKSQLTVSFNYISYGILCEASNHLCSPCSVVSFLLRIAEEEEEEAAGAQD